MDELEQIVDKWTDFVLGRLSAKTFDDVSSTISPLVHASMGLSSEAGEFLDLTKKVAFGKAALGYETQEKMRNELADVLFYWLFAASYVDLTMPDAIQYLKQKLGGGHGWR